MNKKEIEQIKVNLELEKWTNAQLRKAYINAQNEVVISITNSLEDILKIKGEITQADIEEIKLAWKIK